MKNFFIPLFFLVVFASCQKDTTTKDANAARTLQNVSYGTDTAQRMDVYIPANSSASSSKVLVLVHGGAWSSGDKTDFNEYIPVFKQRLPDYVIINVNYRLAVLPSANLFPTQENDVKSALTFIASKASEFKFNSSKLALLGASAGAQLALLQAYKNATPKVNALVDMFGPTDMTALYNSLTQSLERFAFQALMGGTPTSNPALYQSSSAINFVSAQVPPTLILHGGQDPLVPVSQSTTLRDRLVSANVPVQYVFYPNEEHGWTGASLNDTYDKIEAFLKKYNP